MSDKYAALHHPDVQAAIAEDIARQQEILSYKIKIGLDGNHYAVFNDSADAEISAPYFKDCRLACFDGYDNAYELSSSWWHRSGRTKAGNNV